MDAVIYWLIYSPHILISLNDPVADNKPLEGSPQVDTYYFGRL